MNSLNSCTVALSGPVFKSRAHGGLLGKDGATLDALTVEIGEWVGMLTAANGPAMVLSRNLSGGPAAEDGMRAAIVEARP